MNQENPDKIHPEESKISDKKIAADKKMDLIEDDKQIDLGPLFSEKFLKRGKNSVSEVTISITNQYLVIKNEEPLQLHYGNILGATEREPELEEVECCKGREKSKYHMLIIHCYSKITKKPFFGKEKTFRKAFDIEFLTESADLAKKWKNLILQAANNPTFLESLNDFNIDNVPEFKRTFLVFINPFGGSGKAPKRWERARQILALAGCDFVEIRTTHHKHCQEYVNRLELTQLKKFAGILTVSGDGLPHEVINGILSRPDRDELSDIALGPIPGGSGNAIVKNICDESNEETTLDSICFIIAKGKTSKCDITCVERLDGSKIYSFLSFNWAIIADLDIESESMRWMGGFRFDLMGVWKLLGLKKFQARFAYTTTHYDQLPSLGENLTGDDWVKIDDTFTYFGVNNMAYLTIEDCNAPLAKINDGLNHYTGLRGQNNTRGKMMNVLLNLKGGLFEGEQPAPKTGVQFQQWFKWQLEYKKIKAFRLEPYGNRLGRFSIDGEEYTAEKTQAYVMEKLFSLFCF